MIIYKVTNLINNKVYIGQTRIKNPRERFNRHIRESKKPSITSSFHLAIKKYGKENFKFDIICSCKNLNDLSFMECYFILLYQSNIKGIGYNLTSGGESTVLNKECITSMSLKIKEQYKNGRKVWNEGMKYHSNIEPWNKGKSGYKLNHGEKVSKALKGKKKSEIHKENLSKSAINRGLVEKHVQSKNVLCIELGLIFKSAAKAAIYFNTSQGCISNICRKERKTLRGLHFEYTNNNFNVNVLPNTLYKTGTI